MYYYYEAKLKTIVDERKKIKQKHFIFKISAKIWALMKCKRRWKWKPRELWSINENTQAGWKMLTAEDIEKQASLIESMPEEQIE